MTRVLLPSLVASALTFGVFTTQAPFALAEPAPAKKIISGADLDFMKPPKEVQKAIRKTNIKKKKLKAWKPPPLTPEAAQLILARQAMSELLLKYAPRKISDNLNLELYYNTLLRALGQACGFTPGHVFVSASEEAEIFRLPAGFLLVTEGLRTTPDNEAELAALLLMGLNYREGWKDPWAADAEKARQWLDAGKPAELSRRAREIVVQTLEPKPEVGALLRTDFDVAACLSKAGYSPDAGRLLIDRIGRLSLTSDKNEKRFASFLVKQPGIEYRTRRLVEFIEQRGLRQGRLQKARYVEQGR